MVLAEAGRGDWVLCQITSKSYADPRALQIDGTDFALGSLRLTSYARPGKLFTAHSSLVAGQVGELNFRKFSEIRDAITRLIQAKTLTLSKAKIDRAVRLAAAFWEKEKELMPPSNAIVHVTDLLADSSLSLKMEEFKNTAEYARFHEYLLGLSPAEMRELQALMYLGRGDWKLQDFWQECEDLRMENDPEREAQHVMEKAPFVEYISAGFEVLNRKRII